jgi:hypothetical protein
MNKDKLQALFDLWQKRLGLETWDIQLKFDQTSDGKLETVMECCRSEHYDEATIVIQPYVLRGKVPDGVDTHRELTDKFIEKEVVHELLHCVTRDFCYCTTSFEKWIPPVAIDAAQEVIERADEQMVDRLATALVRSFGQPNA